MKLAAWSIVTGISVPFLVLIITKWWDPISLYLGYPFDVRRRVNDLGDSVERLQEMKRDLLLLDPHPSSQQCIGWFKSLKDLQHKVETIKNGYAESGVSYFAMCRFGRQADEERKTADALTSQGTYLLQEARARPHAIRDVQPQHPQQLFWGMSSYKKMVLDFIKDNDPKSQMLGIWGMGGVGKSSLLKLVRDSRSEYDNASFHHVLFVRAGTESTVSKMQKDIATSMGLHLLSDEISQEAIIFNHLRYNNFLLLLDDLWDWDSDKLENVGIPMPLGEVLVSRPGEVLQKCHRKVVFTTRSRGVCGKMGCANNNIQMKCLSKEDAWSLFTHKAGDKIVNDKRIQEFAVKIVEKCGGLPSALCTIGQAMSTKNDPREWRSAIDLLRNSKFHEIIDGHEDLLKCLKFSYDKMGNNLKELFLICSLWPEDENIPKQKLISWWMGLGLIDVTGGTDMGYSVIDTLMGLSMLEEGDDGLYSTESSHVKMHDVIRKMALWIVNDNGSKERDNGSKERWLPLSINRSRSALSEKKWCTIEKAWILPEEIVRLPLTIRSPQLTMLVIGHAFYYGHGPGPCRRPQAHDHNIFSLQLIIPCYQSITFLDLEGMERENFPLEICGLLKLQHLNLSATTINALPLGLENLGNLKYLCIRNTGALKTIPEGLIKGLHNLRVLDLFCSGPISPEVCFFSTVLDELASSTIDMLGFNVQTKADIFQLGILNGVHTQALCMHHFEEESHPDIINLQLLSNLTELRELAIMKSFGKELVAAGCPNDDQPLLPYLEIFELNNLFNLEKVKWKNAWLCIRVVSIYNCNKLRDAMWVQHLQFLEQLTIAYCENMERLFDSAELLPYSYVKFPKLAKLYLEELPKLSMISEQPCQFKELSYVCVARCNELKAIQVLQPHNQKIKIACNKDWWTSLAQNQKSMTHHFTPTFFL